MVAGVKRLTLQKYIVSGMSLILLIETMVLTDYQTNTINVKVFKIGKR